ncbi:WYL domain-containing protein [Ochrobactrum sp. 3-3]|uniref:helix-turn-helix transcriptional regulator n=1 Tax=Ochrobactrum sp. 3-3 TaxID=1830124 RepID=UPI000DEEC036|nr:WYL domain-containing protein [Ochrobactrum sp. 3-3]
MRTEQTDLRRGVERRLEFIEFRLYWDGHVNRIDITETFGISAQQASSDLNRYLGMAASNMAYDKSAKTYVRTETFKPQFLQPDAAGYLAQLKSIGDGLIDRHDAWIGSVPDFSSPPTPARGVQSEILQMVIGAIRNTEALEIRYQSLSRPEPIWRWIEPHALGFDGFRWHVRAFCTMGAVFKDFVLSRILETRDTRPAAADPEKDVDWVELITLRIAPHPALSPSQRRVIELDYGMQNGMAEINVRRAFLYYALRRLGLDTDPAARKPQDQQIVLLESPMATEGQSRNAEGASCARS